MFSFRNGGNLVESISDLPRFQNADILYCDVETDGLRPYQGNRICGVAVKLPDSEAYYIPLRHTQGRNVPLENGLQWLRDVVGTAKEWINHNVKFDAHFCHADGATFTGRLNCTLQRAKIFDSDRFTHKLKPLCREWCELPMEEEDEIKHYLKRIKSKSYADLPADLCGSYACMDVIGNQALDEYMEEWMPDQVRDIEEREIRFTPVLFDMEARGMKVNRYKVGTDLRDAMKEVLELDQWITEATGREFVDHHDCLFDICINLLGLPVLDYNPKSGNAKFDSKTFAAYLIRPDVSSDPRKKEILEKILRRRSIGHHKGLFLEPYWELMDEDCFIHPDYNQLVRTGRMSCRGPNFQQLNAEAKQLVVPRGAFMSCDASQIEFRLIIHYIKDQEAIAQYAEDPDTDFHSWVAEICHTKRGPGKTMNFSMGYGAGMKKVVSQLSSNPDIMAEIVEKMSTMDIPDSDRQEVFEELCVELATTVYDTYHDRLPGIRRLSKKANRTARRRGYVFNAYGRRRHLPPMGAHKAFNSVVQSCAMDIIKDRMTALAPRYNEKMREWGIHIAANVHDEILFECEDPGVFRDPEVQRYIFKMLESPDKDFLVPIRWDMGISERDWCEASKDDSVKIDRNSLFSAA